MKVLRKTYRDDQSNIINKEEFERLYQEFEEKYKEKYERTVNLIIDEINRRSENDKQRLEMIFRYFTNNDMQYNLMGVTNDGRMALDYGYEFYPYKTWIISQNTKYPAVLNKSGVCITYALAFEDLCKRMNIPCKVVHGYSLWNQNVK